MEKKDKFVKCAHMDVRTFIKFIEDYHKQLDGVEIFINRIDKMNNWSVSANILAKETNPITKQENFSAYNVSFIDDAESQEHSAYIDTISGPSVNISDAWNNFLKNKNQKHSQATEAQPE